MTLYYRTTDMPPTTVCSGGCAGAWPPLVATGSSAPTSATSLPGKLSIVADANGNQVAYNGHPLYTFSGDTGAGQTTGDRWRNRRSAHHPVLLRLRQPGSDQYPQPGRSRRRWIDGYRLLQRLLLAVHLWCGARPRMQHGGVRPAIPHGPPRVGHARLRSWHGHVHLLDAAVTLPASQYTGNHWPDRDRNRPQRRPAPRRARPMHWRSGRFRHAAGASPYTPPDPMLPPVDKWRAFVSALNAQFVMLPLLSVEK